MAGAGGKAPAANHCQRELQFDRLTKIFVTPGYTSAMLTFELWVFDQSLVLLLIAKMKALRYHIAKVLAVVITTTF
jgi:hypothetical protein